MNPLKAVGLVLLAIVCLIALSSAMWGWRAVTAPIRGWVGAEEQIESKESRIYNYNWFYDKCATIQTFKNQIENTEDTLDNTEDADTRQMYQQNLLGLKNQLANAVNQYNATARKHYTAARFLDEGLPERVSTTGETTCE